METNKPRNISELLRMDSYADMTDEEINLVIEYRANQAAFSAEMEQKRLENERATDAMIKAAEEQRDHAKIVLEALIANAPQFKSAEGVNVYDPN